MVQLKPIHPNLQVSPPTFSARIFSSVNGNKSLIMQSLLHSMIVYGAFVNLRSHGFRNGQTKNVVEFLLGLERQLPDFNQSHHCFPVKRNVSFGQHRRKNVVTAQNCANKPAKRQDGNGFCQG
jgi:hypothetical protein